ncbi:MAG: BamA/TamA family outer membrane protein [Bacteroidota bacterium]|nr:BamA/TamA family outer membrane protein [Bacteroidota bacterium]
MILIVSAGFLILPGCTIIRKYQKNTPFVFRTNIKLIAPDLSNDDKEAVNSKLNTQLADSAKVVTKDVAFVLHYITRPPVFDTNAVIQSASNMKNSMINLGYYSPRVEYTFDTTLHRKGQIRITTNYTVIAGKRTLIDTLAYHFKIPQLEQLAEESKSESPLQKNTPVTKTAIQLETGRLVDLFRNNGYYKFTADDIRVAGDTTIEALTSVSDDPFEQLQLLSQANERRNKPTIKLTYLLNEDGDSSRLKKYYINNIYLLPDYQPGENYKDSSLKTHVSPNYITRYHRKLFQFNLPSTYFYMKKGDVFSQSDYLKTINGLYKLGAWEAPNIDIIERKDTNLLDMVIPLVPLKKYAFEGNVELSYSANTSNALVTNNNGNLMGVSGNLSITNRNLWKVGARMTNAITAGVEFNTSQRNSNGTFINSKEIGYTNSILFPKFITPFRGLNHKKLLTQQTFLTGNVSQINRVDFFNQQILTIALGYNWTKSNKHLWSYKPFNFDYHRIYNRSHSFDSTLLAYPFLRYSFNTALVMGQSLSYTSARANPKNPHLVSTFKANMEESGLIWSFLKSRNKNALDGNFFNRYLKDFIKTDVEYTYTINRPKSALALRAYGGVGIPLSKSDTTLPFFKQFFGGGPNSMRGWPVRGIGVGGQALAPYSNGLFNDRTGDIQLEGNAEYRFNVAPLFANAVFFRMALFTDIGNIWNFKNTQPMGGYDTTQFKFRNLYKQLGVSSGVGFRFDFTYFLIRFDVAFRFKRPDVLLNDGWQMPAITPRHLLGSSQDDRIWRYENFNATIGIDYPF